MAVEREPLRSRHWSWAGPLLYMLAVSVYFVVRFQGRWAENDSAAFARYMLVMLTKGRLVPSGEEAYPNGYAFQAISTFVLAVTGLDVAGLQQVIYPLISPLVVLPAWVLYRQLTGTRRGAAVATLLLFTQPEFLFVILRSSHEKFTRTFLLLSLFWLVRSLQPGNRPGLFTVHIILFYLSVFGLIAGNNLLAHSFVFAIVIALVMHTVFRTRGLTTVQQSGNLHQRLAYASLIGLGLVYVFTFNVYAPAQHDLLVLQNIFDRIAALFLDVQSQPVNAYSQVSSAWIDVRVYFLLSSANWIILGASFVLWARQGLRWLRFRVWTEDSTAWLLWLLYAAFGAQGALSVLADASGALGSNLQHRIFPTISIVGVAVIGAAMGRWVPGGRWRRLLPISLSVGIGVLAVLSILKATNEPLLSNKWTFYRAGELTALGWVDDHLQGGEIWTELDERIASAYLTTHGRSTNGNRLYANDLNASTRHLLVTKITQLRSSRLQQPIPLPPDALRVYDNGDADIYYRRQRTPFQR